MDCSASNYSEDANIEGPCEYIGCMDCSASNYSEDANIESPCIYLDNCNERKKGDYNNDGKVDVADLVFLQKYLNNDPYILEIVSNDDCFIKIADLNDDKKIDVADLIYLQKYLNNNPNYNI